MFSLPLPEDLQDEVNIGTLVEAPFGRQTVQGWYCVLSSNLRRQDASRARRDRSTGGADRSADQAGRAPLSNNGFSIAPGLN